MISLITSLYQSESHLPSFIKRLEAYQKFLADRKIEIQFVIVANDPNEKELQILERVERQPWVKILKVPRESLYASWNRGVKESRHSFLGFWNVDDNRYPEAIIEALNLFNHGAELVYFPFRYKRFIKILGITIPVKSIVVRPPQFNREEFGQSMHGGPFFLFSRNLYEKVGPFDETFKIAGDFEWCIRAAHVGSFKRGETMAGEFINSGSSLSGGQYPRLDEENQRIYQKYNITSKIKG